jgi:hypothetical protein
MAFLAKSALPIVVGLSLLLAACPDLVRSPGSTASEVRARNMILCAWAMLQMALGECVKVVITDECFDAGLRTVQQCLSGHGCMAARRLGMGF